MTSTSSRRLTCRGLTRPSTARHATPPVYTRTDRRRTGGGLQGSAVAVGDGLRQRRRELCTTRAPASQSVSRSASSSRARRPSRPMSSSSCSSTSPVSSWRQPPTMRPSHHAVGPALPLLSNSSALCAPRYRRAQTSPSWSGRAVAERRHGADRLDVVRVVPAAGRPPARRRALRPPRCRPRPAAQPLGRPQPPFEIGHRAGAKGAEPLLDQRRGAIGLRRRDERRPNHERIEVQRSEVIHLPSFDARTMCPAADNVVRTRGPTATRPPQDLPSPYAIEPSSGGDLGPQLGRRGFAPVGQPVEHLPAGLGQPALTICLQPGRLHVLDEPSALDVGHTRVAAACAMASVSRGKTKRVRRMARCLTSERSV